MELEGRVAIITGAGRGIGREHALLFAQNGCRVVVNDLGGAAEEVVEEIRASGGEAVANEGSASSWDGARRMVEQAVEAFGDLHVLVNNAGILRDRVLVNMSEEEWDLVVDVHLKGHFCPTRWAGAYWREQAKAGRLVRASIINTSSGSGLFGNTGQLNYAAAKAGIATMTLVAARELERYGVRVNAIAPVARTRLTEGTPGLSELMTVDESGFDRWDPAHVSPLVAYLATEDCHLSGQVLNVHGGNVSVNAGWSVGERFRTDGPWEIDLLRKLLADVPAGPPAMGTTT